MENQNKFRQTQKHHNARKFHRTSQNNPRTRFLRQHLHIQLLNRHETRRQQQNTRKTKKQKQQIRIPN